MNRVVLYARYSSDHQNPASITDQFRVGEEDVASWPDAKVVGYYQDAAMSGDSLLLRPDVKRLLKDAQRGMFDVVWCEALNRLSRDLADTATLFKMLRFYGVKLVTKLEGRDIPKLLIAVKGAMNEEYLDNLAQQTHREIVGQVLKGKSGGGLSYGYDVLKHVDAHGEPIRGDRKINPAQAEVIRRVLREYAIGVSPTKIARRLDAEEVTGPSGGSWLATTIRGSSRRGTGLINNRLYIGKLVWNRRTFVKNPATGKKVTRLNPPEMWITTEVPELRIVDDELWQAVKVQQSRLTAEFAKVVAAMQAGHTRASALNATHRPRSFLAGLMVCGCCNASYNLVGGKRYGCSGHYVKRTCPNQRTILREDMEARVLAALRPLLHQKANSEAMRAYVEETNRLNRERHSSQDADRKMLTAVQRQLKEITLAIKDGGYSRTLNAELRELEAQEDELNERLSGAPMELFTHPNVAEIFGRKVEHLAETLQRPEERDEASAALRGLIEQIILMPGPKRGEVAATLHGDLGTILEWTARNDKTSTPETVSASVATSTRDHRSRHPLIVEVCCPPIPAPRQPFRSRTLNVIFQEAASAGVLSTALLGDPNRAIEAAHQIAERLNEHSGHARFWRGEVIAGEGLVFSRTRQGVPERYVIDTALLRSIAYAAVPLS